MSFVRDLSRSCFQLQNIWSLTQNHSFKLKKINTAVPNKLLENQARWFCSAKDSLAEKDEKVKISFIYTKTGEKVAAEGVVGQSVLQVAMANDTGMHGACEGNLRCTTCHVYVDEKNFERLPEPNEKENDLLDNARFLKETSRLGCQCKLSKEIEGAVFTLPLATVNIDFPESD
ncbi:ferredoxin-2, mitochondrial [Trichonephila inaurata madagascariensis]|uniref:Ferredoxin-2, mitochondrial n=1 Tax=Trichonephila inaurata madagascariensis TaxID=2747483 RepID=A0A8X6YXI2_9ARAC|nr:ferredoxin-2, mitochondrial [Trichonephila inaurata madagascariensis]